MPDIHRDPPHDTEAEEGTLASMAVQPDFAIPRVVARLTQEHFYVPRHQTIYAELLGLWKARQKFDMLTFTAHLRKKKVLEAVGGASFVTSLFTKIMPGTAMVDYYMDFVMEAYQRRQLIFAGTEAVRRSYDSAEEIPAIKRRMWDALRKTESRRNENQAGSAIKELHEMIDARLVQSHLGIATGIAAWDKALGGIMRKRYYVIGARPKVGKTALIEQAIQTQMAAGIAVLVFQKDMSLVDMVGRMACRTADVIYQDFTTGECDSAELEKVRKASDLIDTDLLRLYNPANLTAEELAAIIEREIQDHGIQVFYLDLFQRLKTPPSEKVEALSEAANTIRDVIQSTGVPGVILAEILKDADKTRRPHSGQFKYCDGLFSTCDVSIMLWSDDDPKDLVKADGSMLRRQRVMFTIDANRAGGVGDETLHFDRPKMKFYEETDDDF